jgi:hypothetical protein
MMLVQGSEMIALNIFNEEIYNKNGQFLVNFYVYNKFRINNIFSQNKQHKYNIRESKNV